MYAIPATPRPRWEELPSSVRDHIAALLDGDVIAAGTVTTGFGNGFAGRLSLADGRRVFAKIAASSVNSFAVQANRSEIAVTRRMPVSAPVPRLLAGFDTELAGAGEGQDDDARDVWVGLVSELVDGRSPDPRRDGDLARVVDLTTELARFDPCPVSGLPLRSDDHATFGRWSRVGPSAPGLPSYGQG